MLRWYCQVEYTGINLDILRRYHYILVYTSAYKYILINSIFTSIYQNVHSICILVFTVICFCHIGIYRQLALLTTQQRQAFCLVQVYTSINQYIQLNNTSIYQYDLVQKKKNPHAQSIDWDPLRVAGRLCGPLLHHCILSAPRKPPDI